MDLASSREQTAQVAHALCRRVAYYFERQAPHAERIDIRVETRENSDASDSRVLRNDLTFILPDGAHLGGTMTTCYLGGNMYEVDAGVADRKKRFTLCLPQPSAAGEAGSGLKIFDYLFDEVKRAAGAAFLKDISAAARPGDTPG